jgi:hypothetical protein
MWWEYAIVMGGLALAAGYVMRTLHRTFSGQGGACGSRKCGCDHARADGAKKGLKVTPLVQVRPMDD